MIILSLYTFHSRIGGLVSFFFDKIAWTSFYLVVLLITLDYFVSSSKLAYIDSQLFVQWNRNILFIEYLGSTDHISKSDGIYF